MEKMTNRKALEYVVANCTLPQDVSEKIDAMIVSLAKKSANRKPTKTQAENDVLKAKIVDALATFENGATASEVLNSTDELKAYSNQKIATMLNQLKADGKVNKETVKGKSIFTVA